MGQIGGGLSPGQAADIVALRAAGGGVRRYFAAADFDMVLDEWIFSKRLMRLESVWRAGKQVVRDGRHIGRDVVQNGFYKTLERLTRE